MVLKQKELIKPLPGGKFVLRPVPERNLSDRLAGKTVCVALGPEDFRKCGPEIEQRMKEFTQHGNISVRNLDSFVSSDMYFDPDLLLVFVPKATDDELLKLRQRLLLLKIRNPKAAVLLWNPNNDNELASRLAGIREEGFAHKVVNDFVYFPVLMQTAADLIDNIL